ncbi:helix-turn-helix domain-containing protein [Nocardioides sp. MH1]|uniref:helix-turn-helix domain-containing protein n=1 Tax=Nocardioides sp. MH1 TaxID=3242490 RepID=UPI00352290FF
MGQREQASDPINVEATKMVRRAFLDSGLTQEKLSQASGIPRSTLANILSPYAEPRLVHVSQLVRIAIALDLDARDWAGDLQAFERKRKVGDLEDRRARKKATPMVQKRAARGRSGKSSAKEK